MNDKELFEQKRDPQFQTEWDHACEVKAPGFIKARQAGRFEECFHDLCSYMDIKLNNDSFVYFFDFDFRFVTSIYNVTPDYEKALVCGLKSLQYDEVKCDREFCQNYNSVIRDMLHLISRVIEELELQKPLNYQKKQQWFKNMVKAPAKSFEEALQRILFINQLLWQTGSTLVGLGRLDMFLMPFYERDMNAGALTEEKAEELLEEFIRCLHGYYWYKSSVMLGDTGQVMILGGLDKDGNYRCNALTWKLLKLVKGCQLSDPKIVLRVSKNMPPELMQEAVRCMMTGIGSPLLANDEVIIPKLLGFGIDPADAYAYTTSACWEPLIGGKSSSMNNENSLSYITALHNLLMEERLNRFGSFEAFLECYLKYLKREIKNIKRNLFMRTYRRNTLYSIFIDGCRRSKKDIVDGGAKYHNTGMTTVGLGNTVNALLNIQKYVFDEKLYDLVDVKKISAFNFQGYLDVDKLLKTNALQYGKDETAVICLTNKILHFVTEETKDFRTPIGGKLKFGVSSPSYIIDGNQASASFDGRKDGEPFMVHISNENLSSYTEIINFAASLDYGENRFNGNVVDFMVNPSFIERNFDKFVLLLLRGIEVGFFQLQTNVISSDMLLAAKREPQKFQNLIVRVWGFSAYFTELSEDYQNVLIERALRNEGKIA